jgi:archaellum biogenesis ATPase FlaH
VEARQNGLEHVDLDQILETGEPIGRNALVEGRGDGGKHLLAAQIDGARRQALLAGVVVKGIGNRTPAKPFIKFGRQGARQ